MSLKLFVSLCIPVLSCLIAGLSIWAVWLNNRDEDQKREDKAIKHLAVMEAIWQEGGVFKPSEVKILIEAVTVHEKAPPLLRDGWNVELRFQSEDIEGHGRFLTEVLTTDASLVIKPTRATFTSDQQRYGNTTEGYFLQYYQTMQFSDFVGNIPSDMKYLTALNGLAMEVVLKGDRGVDAQKNFMDWSDTRENEKARVRNESPYTGDPDKPKEAVTDYRLTMHEESVVDSDRIGLISGYPGFSPDSALGLIDNWDHIVGGMRFAEPQMAMASPDLTDSLAHPAWSLEGLYIKATVAPVGIRASVFVGDQLIYRASGACVYGETDTMVGKPFFRIMVPLKEIGDQQFPNFQDVVDRLQGENVR